MPNANDDVFFGSFGGQYVAETLRPALEQLMEAFSDSKKDDAFQKQLRLLQKTWVGRPTPLVFAENATRVLDGAKIFIKMEGLAHTGAHKINNVLGQALLAKRIRKKRIIAETGAGQHGLATAAVCAKLGIPCCIYMGTLDMKRQHPNVELMRIHGAEVVAVESGQRTLKDAVNAALRDWAASHRETHYLMGSALGPAPFPEMVRTFQSIIAEETMMQLRDFSETPDVLIACCGGGSNASGFFSMYYEKSMPQLLAVEAGGKGNAAGEHATRMNGLGKIGIAQGYKSFFLMDSDGQLGATHSISAGLDYPGIGPEIAYQGSRGRVEFASIRDTEALDALQFFAKHEGILFALESAHAGAQAIKMAPSMSKDTVIVVLMSGRGEKDLFITAAALQGEKWRTFLKEEVKRK